MSKLMIVLGILAVAAAVALGLLGYFTPGQMQVLGLTAEVAAILLMGGILTIGLGATLGSIDDQRRAMRDLAETLVARSDRATERFTRTAGLTPPETPHAAITPPPAAKPVIPPLAEEEAAAEPKTPIFAGAARILDQARERAGLKVAEAKAAAEETVAETRLSTRDTIVAIEKAKAELESALGTVPPSELVVSEPLPESEPVVATISESVVESEVEIVPGEGDEEQLYVMEEKLIRGRPARVLSDGTVEAETDEGWMRFENLEHLEEYLDAMSPAKG